MAARGQDSQTIILGGMTLRPSTCEIVIGGDRIVLEPQVMRVLATFAANEGTVISRDRLVDLCWDGRSVSEDAINRVISRIRKLAAETGAFELQTQRKIGYRLVATAPKTTAEAPTFAKELRLKRRWAAGLLISFFGIAAVIAWRPWSGTATAGRSIEVAISAALPRDRERASHFASEVRQSLARIRGLRPVTPGDMTTPDLLLEASYGSSAGSPILLTLKQVSDNAAIWTGRFAQSSTTPPPQQRAIAAAVRYLAVWLSDKSEGRAARRESDSPEVSRLSAEGLRALQAANGERQRRNMSAAAPLFEEASLKADAALALNPQSPNALMLRFQVDRVPDYPRPNETAKSFERRKQRADEMLTRALVADPDDAAVLVAAAQDFLGSSDWDAAGALLRRAVKLEPGSPDANSWLAFYLSLMARCDQGMSYAQKGIALDPASSWRKRAVPRLLQCKGDVSKALQEYHRLLRLEPTNSSLAREAYFAALSNGRNDLLRLATLIRSELLRRGPSKAMIAVAERAEAAASSTQGSSPLESMIDLDISNVHRKNYTVSAGSEGDIMFALAYEYAKIGSTSKALQALTKAHDAGSTYLPWALPAGPREFPEPLRSKPGYRALWQNPPAWAELIRERKASK